jgi:hypothetical protein
VHEQRHRLREVFVPLRHDPGRAQVDFGEALAVIPGEERKIHFFAMDLPHSDACLVQAYLAETTEAFCDGHNVSFEFFGGVPCSILYDNPSWRWHASWVTAGGNARGPSVSCSPTTCSPTDSGAGQGQRQGKVEGLVGYAPGAASWCRSRR